MTYLFILIFTQRNFVKASQFLHSRCWRQHRNDWTPCWTWETLATSQKTNICVSYKFQVFLLSLMSLRKFARVPFLLASISSSCLHSTNCAGVAFIATVVKKTRSINFKHSQGILKIGFKDANNAEALNTSFISVISCKLLIDCSGNTSKW